MLHVWEKYSNERYFKNNPDILNNYASAWLLYLYPFIHLKHHNVMGKFIIKTAKDGQNYFALKAGNGETILSSEMYTTKAACNNGIESVKTNAPNDSRYEKQTAKNGEFYFTLKAANFQVIGTSEMYTTSSSRDNGIESVKSNAPGASVTEE